MLLGKGKVLKKRDRIVKLLGQGGCGAVYKAGGRKESGTRKPRKARKTRKGYYEGMSVSEERR